MGSQMTSKFVKWLNAEILQMSYNWQWLKPVGRPVVFQIELTNHCPFTCEMCPRTHEMTRKLGHMPFDLYTRIIDEVKRSTQAVLLHHFGDSLVHPDIGRFIKYADQRGVLGFLSANPVLLTDRRIAALVDNGLEELVLSLDGITSETNVLVRGAAAKNLALAEARIEKLIAYRAEVGATRPRIILQIVEQAQNQHEVAAWLQKWKGKPGLDRVKVKRYITWDNTIDTIKALKPQEIAQPDHVCDKPWTSVTVLWDGRVVPCCFDYDGKQVLGDLNTQSLSEIWNGARLRALKKAHATGSLDKTELCATCVDKEGFPTRKIYYPLNRLLRSSNPLGEEKVG